jgi:hypothetical protein
MGVTLWCHLYVKRIITCFIPINFVRSKHNSLILKYNAFIISKATFSLDGKCHVMGVLRQLNVFYMYCVLSMWVMSVKSSLELMLLFICPTLDKTFCILYFVVSALIDSEGECIAKSMSQEKTRSNHSKSPDSKIHLAGW